jgi:hypothetical protein
VQYTTTIICYVIHQKLKVLKGYDAAVASMAAHVMDEKPASPVQPCVAGWL